MSNKVKGKVRLALIGCGGISSAHAKGILEHPDKVQAVALVDVDEARMAEREKQLGCALAKFTDWRKMLAEVADQIDAVVICLPHHLHKPAIVDAARAGKHVLCEKPLCLNLKEADEIGAVVKEAGITYMSGHNTLFLPTIQEARKMIENGDLGRILWIRTQDCFRLSKTREGLAWRANRATQGGGELIDTGYHPTYQLMYLAGSEAVAVRATFGRFALDIDGEDTASVQVRFRSGTIGEIFTSWAIDLPAGTHRFHVIGEKGEVYGSHTTLYWRPKGFAEGAHKTFPAVSSFSAQMAHFAECLQTGRRPLHGFEEGREVLRIILDATQSAKGWEAS